MRTFTDFKKRFFICKKLNKKDYSNGRRFFIFEGIACAAIFTLTSGAYLAGLMHYLGASDELIGIISAIPPLTASIQMFSPLVLEKLSSRKMIVVFSSFTHRLLLGSIGLIPLLFVNRTSALYPVTFVFMLSHTLVNFVSPASSNWLMSLVPQQTRGAYFGKKDSFSSSFIMLFSIVMGCILDKFKLSGHEYRGFVFISLTVTLLAIIDFIILLRIKEPEVKLSKPPVLKDVLLSSFKNEGFRKIIILFALWNIGLQIASPFFSIFMISKLKLSYTYITSMGLISSLASIIAVRKWGDLADKHSWSYTTKLSIGLLSLCHTLWFFICPRNMLFLIPIVNMLSGISWSGINISMFNIPFVYAPKECSTAYIGFNTACSGIIGFLSALLGSFIVSKLDGTYFYVGPISVSNIQITFITSGVLLLLCALYVHFCVRSVACTANSNSDNGQKAR